MGEIIIATWNVRILRAAGKFEKPFHEIVNCKVSGTELYEMGWKHSREIPTDDAHKAFLEHKDIVKTGIGCRLSSRQCD